MVNKLDIVTNESMLIVDGFDEPVLYAPSRLENVEPCNSLKIITAFTDCERISTHLISLQEGIKCNRFTKGINVDIILGMTKSSLSHKKHNDICRLIGYINNSKIKGMPTVSCRYICNGPEVHSKVYIWSKSEKNVDEVPQKAYCGSLNYTMNAFYKRRESVCVCDSQLAYEYYKQLLPDTIDCFDASVTEKINQVINNGPVN